jgi:Uma2 family endonuclease
MEKASSSVKLTYQDLIVEVLSPLTKRVDQGAKLYLHGRFGVPEYWTIDPDEECVRVYRLKDGSLASCEELHGGDGTSVAILTTPLFPDLTIPLAKIFD